MLNRADDRHTPGAAAPDRHALGMLGLLLGSLGLLVPVLVAPSPPIGD